VDAAALLFAGDADLSASSVTVCGSNIILHSQSECSVFSRRSETPLNAAMWSRANLTFENLVADLRCASANAFSFWYAGVIEEMDFFIGDSTITAEASAGGSVAFLDMIGTSLRNSRVMINATAATVQTIGACAPLASLPAL
jgi:hypothetical protein